MRMIEEGVMDIRHLALEDEEALRQYCLHQNEAMKARPIPGIETPSLLTFEELKEELLSPGKLHICVVAYSEETQKMCGGIVVDERNNMIGKEKTAYLHSLWVNPECQGQGIAKKVMLHACEAAAEQKEKYGLVAITSMVHGLNVASQKVHQKCGLHKYLIRPCKQNSGNKYYFVRFLPKESLKQKIFRWRVFIRSWITLKFGI